MAFELVWLVIPRIGSYPVSPRMRQAIEAHANSPQARRDAAIDKAARLDGIESDRQAIAVLMLVLALDCILVYFFWNYGAPKRAVVKAGTIAR